MNTFTFFALVICAILAMVSAVPSPSASAEMVGEGTDPSHGGDVLEGAESRGHGYNRRGGDGYYGGGGRGHNRGHYGHDHHHHGR